MNSQKQVSSFASMVVLCCLVFTPAEAQFLQQESKLVGTGAVGGAQQGYSVSVSADGNTAIVGGYYDSSLAGAAWVFTRSLGVWTQQGNKLVGTGAVGNAWQGRSVSISGDGNTAVVGGPADNGNAGAMWVFTRSSGVWSQQGGKLVGTGAVGIASQGNSVSVSADGNTAIMGGAGDNSAGGAIWVFTRNLGVWSQQGSKLVGTGGVGVTNIGFAVSLSPDGNTATAAGAADSNDVGAVWVFTRNGGSWSQQGSKLVGTGAGGFARQGYSVSVSSEGNVTTAIAGGFYDNNGAGAAWVFTRSLTTWSQQGSKLVGTGAVGNAAQGRSVCISSDGNTAIVAGPDDNSNAGAAWAFTRSVGVWTQQGSKLVGTGAVGNAGQGRSVSLSSDGSTAIVGGPSDDAGKGAAWVYSASPSAVRETPSSKHSFRLSENYPNPFNPSTQISYSVPTRSYVSLVVYDVLGREVSRLVQATKTAGEYSATWNADGVPSGVYFYRLTAGSSNETKKMLLMR